MIVREGKMASSKEYAPLARELRQIGYKLKIGKRVPRNALEIRREKLTAMSEKSWLITKKPLNYQYANLQIRNFFSKKRQENLWLR